MSATQMAAASPNPPSQRCAPQRTLIRFATLLGNFFMKETSTSTDALGQTNADGSELASEKSTSASSILPCNDALASLLLSEENGSISSFPSLSLDSATAHHPHHASNLSKHQVEALAADNLSRPIVVSQKKEEAIKHLVPTEKIVSSSLSVPGDNSSSSTNSGIVRSTYDAENVDIRQHQAAVSEWQENTFPTNDISSVPRSMLTNLSASFSLLVDARLRAYGTILARHAASFHENGLCDEALHHEEDDESSGASTCAAVERKLGFLLEIGENAAVDALVTVFHVRSGDDGVSDVSLLSSAAGQGMEVATMSLVFEAVMDISIPTLKCIDGSGEGDKDRLTISMRAPGTITGTFMEGSDHSHLESVNVHINTHALLASMIDQACVVVAKAVENVNQASARVSEAPSIPTQIGSESEVEQGITVVDSAMPPPEPRVPAGTTHPQKVSQAKEPLSNTLRKVVSPDLAAIVIPPCPTPLRLGQDATPMPSVPSPPPPDGGGSCAAIVDWVMGEVNDSILGPPSKRARLAQEV